jgi:N-acetylglutamate synthase
MAVEFLGRRVVLRRRAGERDGRPIFSDVLGELIESGDELVVRRADGSIVAVPAGEVHRLKPVPPGRADVLALEELAARSWPAPETERLGGWLLRAGEGWTRRANSALLLGNPGLPVPDALDRVRAWYLARGLPPRLSIPLPVLAPLDHIVARLGWSLDVDVEVLTGPVIASPADPQMVHVDHPNEEWKALYQAKSVPPVGERILAAPDRVTFASLIEDGEVRAIGRGVVVDDWLGITSMEVSPEHRRRGLAGRMLRALLTWGAEHHATRCYIQVEATNGAAIALYNGLGFAGHHRYRTRYSIR